MGERKPIDVDRIASFLPGGWSATIEGDEVHISDGGSPSGWEAHIDLEHGDEIEIVRQLIFALHCDLVSIGREIKGE